MFPCVGGSLPPQTSLRSATVSAPASVGASKLRLEVATAGPHPCKHGRYK